LRKTRDRGLLEALHRDLFLPNFPDADEQEDPDDWSPRLWEQPEPPQPEQHGFVAGAQLSNPEDRALAAFAFIERYRQSRCALLSYIAVENGRRGQGLGRRVFQRALSSARQAAEREGHPLRAVFAEIHDPARVGRTSDVIDPTERVRVMQHLGGWRVPVSYVQPALDEDSERSDRLMLIAFPLDGATTIDASAVSEFLSEYYRALGIADLAADPDLNKVETELESLGGREVDLVMLEP
jgi:GNAT superfamily N-acetyltransferase